MDFVDLLRVFVLVGLVCGAWQSWKALPKPTFINGRRCYCQPDGSYRTWWGKRVKVPEGFLPPEGKRPD